LSSINIFCFGFGKVAKNFINKIKSENFKINLSTTSTTKTCQKSINGLNYENYFFKDEAYDDNLIEKLKEADHILISIPPVRETDQVIKNFSKIIEDCKAKWITYLSATSIYGDHKGEWVNEKSITKPTSPKGVARLKAEKSWLSLNTNKNLPVQIFRLSGIYSNENNILIRLKSGNASLINKQNNFFSRIHVEDIANILFKSLSNFKPGEIYNISDDKPSSLLEVTLYGTKLLNMDKPKMIEFNDIKNEMLKNFYKDSKKVNNQKMKSFFNYNLKFPTYIEGLSYIRDNFI
jgi:nucleoside-diphosphate-sugar epimerase|tara:strand:- start:425 stop:1300 length:876 start_codon:yes stop_codon:yes gene_type:complete